MSVGSRNAERQSIHIPPCWSSRFSGFLRRQAEWGVSRPGERKDTLKRELQRETFFAFVSSYLRSP